MAFRQFASLVAAGARAPAPALARQVSEPATPVKLRLRSIAGRIAQAVQGDAPSGPGRGV
jgi:hypothetical protein